MTDYTVNFEYNFENCVLADVELEMYEVNDIMQYIDGDIDLIDVLNIQVFSHSLGYDVFVEFIGGVVEYVDESVKTNEYKFINADLSEDQYYDFIASLRELSQKEAVI